MPSSSTCDSYLAQSLTISAPSDAYIDGKAVPAASGRRFRCLSPRD